MQWSKELLRYTDQMLARFGFFNMKGRQSTFSESPRKEATMTGVSRARFGSSPRRIQEVENMEVEAKCGSER